MNLGIRLSQNLSTLGNWGIREPPVAVKLNPWPD
jgi:hypothetical protein